MLVKVELVLGRPIGNTPRTVEAVFKTFEKMGIFPFRSGASEFAFKNLKVRRNVEKYNKSKQHFSCHGPDTRRP